MTLEDVKKMVERKVRGYEAKIREVQEAGEKLTAHGYELELKGFLYGVEYTVIWTLGAEAAQEITEFIFELGW